MRWTSWSRDQELETDSTSASVQEPRGIEADLIRYMSDAQEEHFNRLRLSFAGLNGRRLQLIDCQNLFCEVDKYARLAHPEMIGYSGRTRIKQRFTPVDA